MGKSRLKWPWMGLGLAQVLVLAVSAAEASSASGPGRESCPATCQIEAVRRTLPTLSPGNCASVLGKESAEIHAHVLSFEELRTPESSLQNLAEDVMALKLQARSELKRLVSEDPRLSEACVDAFRVLLQEIRSVDEYFVRWNLKRVEHLLPPAYGLLSNRFPEFVPAPGHESFRRETDLKSGDLLMSRGPVFTSATIARMGDVPGQFSHIALVYVDPATHQAWVVESHIEVGVAARKIEEYFNDDNIRVVVLRANDPSIPADVPARAAELMFRRVKAAQDTDNAIPYNFSLDLAKEDELFCSQVAYVAYRDASQGKVLLPLFQSSFAPKNRAFFDRMDISVRRSFVPNDMEVDPRFEVIAEWRNLSRIEESRSLDAVMDAFFRWSNDLDYELIGSLKSFFIRWFIHDLRRWPIFNDVLGLKGRFPLNMTRDVLATIVLLDSVSEDLGKELSERNEEALSMRQFPLSSAEMTQALDRFRENDYERFRDYEAWSWKNSPRKGVSPPPPPFPHFHYRFR